MVYFSDADIDHTFAALADPTRREILARLADAPALSVSEIATPLPISLVGVMKHIGVLERAGLVVRQKTGRTVMCRLEPAPLANAAAWLAHYRQFWETRLDRLAAFVERETWQENSDKPKTQSRRKGRPASASPGTSTRRPSGYSTRGRNPKR